MTMTDTLTKNTSESLRTKLGCSRINLNYMLRYLGQTYFAVVTLKFKTEFCACPGKAEVNKIHSWQKTSKYKSLLFLIVFCNIRCF